MNIRHKTNLPLIACCFVVARFVLLLQVITHNMSEYLGILKECSSKCSLWVQGDTGSEWIEPFSWGVRLRWVWMRFPGRPCSTGCSSSFWLPLFSHCGSGIPSRFCISTACCWSLAASEAWEPLSNCLATPSIIPRSKEIISWLKGRK